jgi:hypothetical protein
VANALDLLDQQVDGFGEPVGQARALPAEELVLPPPDRRGERVELEDLGGAAVRVEALETTGRSAISRSRTRTRRPPRPTSIWAPTTKSDIPSSAVAPSLRCITVKGLLL